MHAHVHVHVALAPSPNPNPNPNPNPTPIPNPDQVPPHMRVRELHSEPLQVQVGRMWSKRRKADDEILTLTLTLT